MNTQNYCQVIEMTNEEKLEMYMKLSKVELAKMLIAANDTVKSLLPNQLIFTPVDNGAMTYNPPDFVPYHVKCSCNPANGGSGICGCVMGNKMVRA